MLLFQHAIFDWDESSQGLILSGFYYGYAMTQVPGGYLAERFGGKWTLGLGLLSTALFTFITPVVVRAGGSTWLFLLRVLQGMGEVSHKVIKLFFTIDWYLIIIIYWIYSGCFLIIHFIRKIRLTALVLRAENHLLK